MIDFLITRHWQQQFGSLDLKQTDHTPVVLPYSVSARLLASTPVCFFSFYGHLLQQLLVKRFTPLLSLLPFTLSIFYSNHFLLFLTRSTFLVPFIVSFITPPFPTWSLSTPLKTNSFDGESPWRILNFFFTVFTSLFLCVSGCETLFLMSSVLSEWVRISIHIILNPVCPLSFFLLSSINSDLQKE